MAALLDISVGANSAIIKTSNKSNVHGETSDANSINVGTVTLVIDNVNTERVRYNKISPIHDIANLKWYLESLVDCDARGLTKYLSLSLFHHSTHDLSLWSSDVDVAFKLRSQETGKEDFVRRKSTTINYYRRCCKCTYFVELTTLECRANGYVKNGKIVLEARVTVKNSFTNFKPTFNFTSPSAFSDVILSINGTRLHVNQDYLSMHSPVFADLFFGDCNERPQGGVPLNDVVLEEFFEFLQVIYPTRKPIEKNNVKYLLKLSAEYEVQFVKDACENFIIHCSTFSIGTKLLLGDKYRLVGLQSFCLNSLQNINEICQLNESIEFSQLSEITKTALLERVTDLKK